MVLTIFAASAAFASTDEMYQVKLNKNDLKTKKIMKQLGLAQKEIKEIYEIRINDNNREEIYDRYELDGVTLEENEQIISESLYIVTPKIERIDSNSLIPFSAVPEYDYDIVYHSTNVSTTPKNIADNDPMEIVLNTIFNYSIGQVPYSWVASTILGVIANNFSAEVSDGDILWQHYHKAYTDKYIRIYDPDDPNWFFNCAKATKLNLNNILDLEAIDDNGYAVEIQDTESTFYKTKYYDNNDYLIEKARLEYWMFSGVSMWVDIEWEETSPW